MTDLHMQWLYAASGKEKAEVELKPGDKFDPNDSNKISFFFNISESDETFTLLVGDVPPIQFKAEQEKEAE